MAVWLICLHPSGRPSLWLSGFSNCQLDNPRDLTLQAGNNSCRLVALEYFTGPKRFRQFHTSPVFFPTPANGSLCECGATVPFVRFVRSRDPNPDQLCLHNNRFLNLESCPSVSKELFDATRRYTMLAWFRRRARLQIQQSPSSPS